jgi:hypothetical protein
LADDPQPSFEEKQRQEKIKDAEHFRQLYSNWLSARGEYTNPVHDDDDDDDNDLLADRIEEAARLLFVTPAVHPYMVWQKIEAFEFYFCDTEGRCRWPDERQLAFFGCIKADLARHGIGGGE